MDIVSDNHHGPSWQDFGASGAHGAAAESLGHGRGTPEAWPCSTQVWKLGR
jgi:hypothetical protein